MRSVFFTLLLGCFTCQVAFAEDPTPPEATEEKPPKKIWENRLEAGVNGSEGNSSNFSLRVSGETKRTTEKNRLRLGGQYTLDYSENEDTGSRDKTGNRGTLDGKSEWPFAVVSRFNIYVDSSMIYDEFKDYDFLYSGHTGLGYDVLKKEGLLLNTHAGAGVSKKFGQPGPDEGWTPEAALGALLDWDFSKLQKLVVTTDLFPILNDLGELRWTNKVSLTTFFSEAKKFGVSLGIDHRYESKVAVDTKNNDLDYFATLTAVF